MNSRLMTRDELRDFPMSVQRQIYQLVKLYQFCDRVCLTEHGVGATQGYTLLSVPQTGSVSMNDLSNAMGLANSTTTRIVDQLVRKELVNRKSDSADRRVVRVELTAKGRELRRVLDKELEVFFKQALEDIPQDERSSIVRALSLVTDSMAKALQDAERN